jgi:anti-sigma factor RsiW
MKKDRRIIHKAVDGELNKEETKEFQFTLKKDPEVRREFQELKAVDETAKAAQPEAPVPQNFKEKVIGKIRDTEIRKRPQ